MKLFTAFGVFFFMTICLWGNNTCFDPACQAPIQIQALNLEPPCKTQKNQSIAFTVDLLIWDAREEGLEYAYKNTQTQMNQELSSYEPQSKFAPGFRIGVSGFLPYDQWTFNSLYTYYHSDRHDSAYFNFDKTATPGPGMIAVWTYPTAFHNQNIGARFQKAASKWKLHSSFLDIALRRSCFLTSCFSVNPSFGIRSAWLHQRYDIDYSQGNLVASTQIISSQVNMSCASNHLGPLFGLGATWRFGKGWDLFSDFSGSFLAAHFCVGRKEADLSTNTALFTESVKVHNSYWTFRPQGQIALGFRFSNECQIKAHPCRYHFSAAFEMQMWWKQNQFLRYLDNLTPFSAGANVFATQGDLMLLGANLEAGFDF